jgi:hypothetical protein
VPGGTFEKLYWYVTISMPSSTPMAVSHSDANELDANDDDERRTTRSSRAARTQTQGRTHTDVGPHARRRRLLDIATEAAGAAMLERQHASRWIGSAC